MGAVHFENDHVATILDFGDLQWGNILITKVYFVEGLGHNLFSVGQFCDADLEVAFTCFVRNLDRVDMLKGNRSTNLYTINLHAMTYSSPICLMTRATSTKSWLLHQRLSNLNFDTINKLAKKTSSQNRRTKKVMETMNVTFDELSAMAFEQRSSKPELQGIYGVYVLALHKKLQRIKEYKPYPEDFTCRIEDYLKILEDIERGPYSKKPPICLIDLNQYGVSMNF
ncbi:hypothetical protein Tco_0944518 [Tanacetum coccineum]